MSMLRLALLCTSRCEGSSSLRHAFISSATRIRQRAAAANHIESQYHSSAMQLQPFATPRHRRLAATSSSTPKARVSKSAKANLRNQSSPALAVADPEEDELESTSSNIETSASAVTTAVLSPPEISVSSSELLHPDQMLNGTIPYPKSLSPSAILEFKNCPQSFLFQYLWDLKQPTTLVLAKGSMCHEALDKIFDLEPQDRTLQHLHNLFRSSWAERRKDVKYRHLFERIRAGSEANGTNGVAMEDDVIEWDVTSEQEWGRSGLQLLQNYFNLEDPREVLRPNPIKREIWVRADLTLDPALGITGSSSLHVNDDNVVNGTEAPTFHVRGIVDRLDMVKVSKSQVALRIVDYKTGKAPNLKYSKAMNEHIRNEVFYQLKIYALLLREKNSRLHSSKVHNNSDGAVDGHDDTVEAIPASVTSSTSGGALDLRLLRLFYLTSESGRAQHVDFDLGPTQEARDTVLQEIHADLSKIWTSIIELVATQDAKAFVGCKRSFCYCHQCRPRFVPGTLWEPDLAP